MGIRSPRTQPPASTLREAMEGSGPLPPARCPPVQQRLANTDASTWSQAERVDWDTREAKAILRLDEGFPRQGAAVLPIQSQGVVAPTREVHGYDSPRYPSSPRVASFESRVQSPSSQYPSSPRVGPFESLLQSPSPSPSPHLRQVSPHSPRVPPPQSSPLMRPCLRDLPAAPPFSRTSSPRPTDGICTASDKRQLRLAALGAGGRIVHEVDSAARSPSVRRCSKELQKRELQLGYLDRWNVRDPVSVQLKYS